MSKYRILPVGGGGGIVPSGTLDIRSEGTFDVTDYASVDVDIFDDTTTKTVTDNGVYNAEDDHVLGYSQVTVQVPASAVVSGTKSITQNGTGIDVTDYQYVDVNVSSQINDNYLCLEAVQNTTVTLVNPVYTSNNYYPVVYYSTDNKQNWSQMTQNTSIPLLTGEKVYFYGENPLGICKSNLEYVCFGGDVNVSGDIKTLFDRTLGYNAVPAYGCYALFMTCEVVDASGLVLDGELGVNCYNRMFESCTLLTQAPALPATTLAQSCYNNMFKGCTSLTQAPALPATTLAQSCYYNMFNGCTALTTAPELPATTLATSCYSGMFQSCSSLVNVPATLPATTLASYCYSQMFFGCTSLTQAPVLHGMVLLSNSYASMFGSTNITRIETYATDISATNCLQNWLSAVPSFGDFYNLGGASYTRGVNGIPTYWTEHTSL